MIPGRATHDCKSGPPHRRIRALTAHARRVAALLLLAAVTFGSVAGVQAADPAPRIRHVYVPFTELDRDLLGDRRPIRLSELKTLIAAEQIPHRPQPQAVLDRADYTATFGGSSLRDGRFTWEVQRTSNTADWLQLNPLELVLKQLAWKDAPAVWGRAPDERMLLLIDRPNGELTGEWELSGRELAQGTVFDFEVPQAAIARLHLRVANAYQVKWTGNEVASSTAPAEEGWTTWTLNFGSRTNIRFAITRKSSGPAAAPLTLVQQQLIYGIRSEGVRLQADFNLDVLNAPVSQLEFAIDPDLQILSASYGEVPLAWREETSSDRRIIIDLPDALTGLSRGVRLKALTSLRTGQPWTLPGIRLRDGVLSDGQISLQLQKPLELKQFETRGCRQTGIESAADEENIAFRQFRPDASLRVTLGTTALKTSARVFTDLQTSSEGWNLASQIDWTAGGGSAFSRQCRIPADWQITEVQLEGAEDFADWNVTTDSRGTRLLTLQFLDALSPEHPKRIEIQARRLPAGADHPIPIPMFEPLDVDELDALTAINSEASVRPLLEPRTTYDPVRIDDIPASWAESPFWKSRWEFRRPTGLLLRLNQARPEGDFYLQSLQTPIEVRATVRADLGRDRLGEAVALSIVPQHGRIERVLVYLSETGPPPVWTFTDGGSGPVEAKRLPSGRHAAWDLPPDGELWELRFPAAQGEPFGLQARRVRNVGAHGRVSLAFVPQASSFEGQAEFRLEEGQQAQLQPHNLTTIPRDDAEAGERPASTWSYTSTSAGLEFMNARDPQAATPQVVSRLWLFSQLDWAEDGLDLHWARYTLGETPGDADFQWELPAAAELLSIRLDGLPVSAVQDGHRWVLSGLGGSQPHEIELHYRVPSHKRFAVVRREVPLPRVGLPVLRFDWDMSLPNSVRLGDVPAGMDMIAGRPQLSWAQRLCGPLGRIALPANSATGSEPIEKLEHKPLTGSPALLGRQVWRAASAAPPAILKVELWSALQARLLAWLGVLGAMFFGAVLRACRSPYRAHQTVAWVSLCLFAALTLPPLAAEIAGGWLTGTVLVTLAPRLWMRRPILSAPSPRVPMGSTQTFVNQLGTLAPLLLMLVGGAAVCAAEAVDDRGLAALRKALADPASVIVPTDSDGRATGEDPLVYVPRELLKSLQPDQGRQRQSPAYLMMSAAYAGEWDQQRGPRLRATFDITVLAQQPTVSVQLPLTNVNLGGPEACVVDGRPAALSLLDERAGIAVEVSGSMPDAPPARRRIELSLYPLSTTNADGGSFAIGIPRVPYNRLKMTFATPFRRLAVPTAHGAPARSPDNRELSASWSDSPELRVVWSRSEPVEAEIQVEAAAAAIVDVQPALLRYHYRLNCRIVQGQSSTFVWMLPAGIAVRSASAPGLTGYTVHPGPDGANLLQLEFGEPQSSDFVAHLEFLWPNIAPVDFVSLPALVLAPPAGTGGHVRITSHQIALRAPSEFQLDSPLDAGEQIALTSVDAFLEVWGPEAVKPQIAMRVLDPVALRVGIRPRVPERFARLTAVGRITPRRLYWTLTAVVDVRTAAAFQHQLQVDPRLQINSVTVQEDAADRLLRWSRYGEQILLFLRDKTIGSQTIVVSGTMPLQVPQEFALPRISIADAEVIDSKLALFQDLDLAVEVVDADRLERIESSAEQRTLGMGPGLLVGRFKSPAADVPVVVRTALNEPQLECETVSSLQVREGRWRLNTALVYHILQGHGSRFIFRIPPELSQFEIEAGGAKQLQDRAPDGWISVTLIPTQPVHDEFTVKLAGPVNLPTEGTWRIPEVTPVNASLTRSYVVLAESDTLTVPEARASGLQPEVLPAELERELPPSEVNADVKSFRAIGHPWRIALAERKARPRETGALLVETQVRFDRSSNAFARTLWAVPPTDLEALEIARPPEAIIEAVLVDGRLSPFKETASDRIMIPLSTPQLGQMVVLYWTRPGTAKIGWFAERSLELPQLINLKSSRAIVRVLPPNGCNVALRGLDVSSEFRQSIQRLDALLQFLRLQSEAGAAGNVAFQAELQHSVLDEITRLQQLRDEATTEERQQLERLRREASQLPPVGETREANPQTVDALFEWTAGEQALGADVESPPKMLRLWMIDQNLWSVSWAAIAGCAAFLIGLRLIRWGVVEWLSRHPAAAAFLLAGFWIVCLAPIWPGLVFAALGCVWVIKGWLGRAKRIAPMPVAEQSAAS